MRSFRFMFLADCQLGCYATFSGATPDDVERFARRGMKVRMVPKTDSFEWDSARYREAIAAANRLRPDFVVLGGDMIEDPTNDDQLHALMSITKELDPAIPMRWIPGNHDAATNTVVPTSESLAWYRGTFGPDRYAFDHEGVAFVAMDSTVLHRPEKVPDEAEAALAALEADLRAARDRSAPHIIVFSHHPLFVEHTDEPDTYWNLPGPVRRRVLALLHEHGVQLMLSGHLHRNNDVRDGDLQIQASSAVGFPLGDDPPGYRVVEVSATGIRHEYHTLEEATA